MSVQINEILSLNVMQDFKRICGKKGLDRRITKVGILDHELGEVIDKSFIEGEFVLTNLLIIKDDLTQLEDVLRRLIQAKTSGMAIKTLYINEVPQKIIDIAEANDYPIFLYETAYYEDIITELVDYIKESEVLSDQMIFVNALHNETLSIEETHQIAYKLNADFKAWVCVCTYSLLQKNIAFSAYHANKVLGGVHRCYIDDNRIVVILSFDSNEYTASDLQGMMESIGLGFDSTQGGCSSLLPISKLNIACLEASFALHYSQVKSHKGVSQFKNLGMYQALMPLATNRWLIQYCERIIMPLIEYDEKNGAELVKTARLYIELGCDIKKTAEALFQHGNTIRYRMDRIKGLLEGRVEKAFIDQELAVAIRWYEMNH